MEFHVLCLLLTVLCYNAAGVYAQNPLLPPKITPFKEDLKTVPSSPHHWTNVNSSFQLICEGQRAVFWTFPGKNDSNKVSYKNVTAWKHETDLKYPFVSHLQVVKSSYKDTGYYYCSYDPDKVDEEEETASVYIFVRDESHLLVSAKEGQHYQAVQYRSIEVDCRPTFGDVNVSLWIKDDRRVDIDQRDDEEPRMKVTFDPTKGFTLDDLHPTDSNLYECKATKGNQTNLLDFRLYVLMHIDSVPKPTIKASSVHVAVGATETLNCTVNLESFVFFSLHWTIPNPRAIAEKRIIIHNTTLSSKQDINGMRKKIGSSLLRIVNASKADSGNFTCVVNDHANNTNFATKLVNVLDDSEKFIILKPDSPIPSIMAGEDVRWVVQVEAFPKAEKMMWWAPNGHQIIMGSRYIIKESQTQASLEIRDIHITDTGIYTLQVMNSVMTNNVTLKLIVEDIPAVTLSPEAEDYYMNGKSYELNCSVVGYPLPKVHWFFSICDNAQNCTIKKEPVAQSKISKDDVINGTYYSTLNWKAERSGSLFCSAENDIGYAEDSRQIWVTDIMKGFQLGGKPDEGTTVEGDNITLNCGASKVNYSSVHWLFNSTNDALLFPFPPNVVIINKTTQFSYQSSLTITNITQKNKGMYTCRARPFGELLYENEGEVRSVTLTIKAMRAPTILRNDMDSSTIELGTDDKIDWTCLPTGEPPPVITWYKDGKPLIIPDKHPIYDLFQENRSLSIKYQSDKTEGNYVCEASNRAGKARRSKTIKFRDKGPSAAIIATILLFVIISLILVVMLGLKIRRERKLQNELKVAGLAHFEEGALDCINPELPIDDQAELLPYDRKWEFPREKLKLGKQLGAGAFGVVMKAEANGIHDGEAITTVAVKMVKRNAEYTYIKALASELKIMVHLGKHLNVVNLLGACTKNLTKRELLVIVEYCRFGNLHNYLLRHRADFIDQVDPKTGQIDPTLGADIMARHESFNSKSRLKYAALSFSNSSGDMIVDYRVPGSHSNSGDSTEQASICMTPAGEEGCMLSNNSVQPEWRSNYQPDYKGNVRPICTRDLLCWAFQVARGMEYLAGRKVLHGDLAARNILLADNNVVKICDFGLAKSMYKSDNYRKKGDGPLPVKWMAIESIRDRVFSTQSDVWSFGIVLWEFFSLAKTPYPGMEADEKLYMKLVEGYRMDKPEFATREIYETIDNCWLARPNDRPTFSDLAEELGSMLEDSVRMHYIDLNGPYMEMNTLWKSGNQNDYLAMMSAPTYGNLIAPVEDEDEPHRYVNSPGIANESQDGGENSGYLCMKSPDLVIFSPRASNPGMFNFSPDSRRLRSTGTSGSDELKPMLSPARGDSGSDSDYRSPNSAQIVNNLNKDTNTNNFKQDNEEKIKPNIAPSFSNPSYHTMSEMLNPTSDNYINMPQQKLANGSKPDTKNTDMPTSISNPNYVSMGKVEGVVDSPNHSLLPNSMVPGKEDYVNLPSQDHNLSSASSGFQSDMGESPYVN